MSDQALRRTSLVVLSLTSLIFGALLVPAVFAGPFSLMAFHQGISAAAVLFVCCMLSLPILILLSIPGSWICHRQHGYREAISLSLLPTINLLVISVLFNT